MIIFKPVLLNVEIFTEKVKKNWEIVMKKMFYLQKNSGLCQYKSKIRIRIKLFRILHTCSAAV